jgi:hypothetical protein
MRRLIGQRAGRRCEYCLLDEALSASAYQVDHIIAEKHGGETTLENLALSCALCNRRKGSDIAAIDPGTGQLVALYNPRTQIWTDHFKLDGAWIVGLTAEGRATVQLLRLNSFERVTERAELVRAGSYPVHKRAE